MFRKLLSLLKSPQANNPPIQNPWFQEASAKLDSLSTFKVDSVLVGPIDGGKVGHEIVSAPGAMHGDFAIVETSEVDPTADLVLMVVQHVHNDVVHVFVLNQGVDPTADVPIKIMILRPSFGM
jgi:hypothetical protein